MAENSTLFSNESFIALAEKYIKEKALPDDQFCPGDAVINNILNFSKSLEIIRMDFSGEKLRGTGLAEIILN